MTSQVKSPLSGKEAKFVRTLKVSDIIQAYRTELAIAVESYFGDSFEISIYECLETGYRFYYPFHIMGDPEFYAALQSSETYYPKWKWENEKSLEFIQTHHHVLDVGCGEGNFLKALYKKNIQHVYGLDQSSEALVFNDTTNIPISNESIESFSKKNEGTFDVLVCFQILEHITDVRSFITDCLRCLKAGGYLIIAVPNNNPYLYKHDLFHTLNLPPHHAGLWNKRSLAALAPLFNLKLVKNVVEPIEEQVSEYTRVQMNHLASENRFFKWCFKHDLLKKIYSKLLFMNRSRIEGRNCLAVYQKIDNLN